MRKICQTLLLAVMLLRVSKMIITMKLFAVLCLAFVLSACGSTNSATPVAPVEWPATPVGMTTQEFLNAFGVATSNASGEFFGVSDTSNVGAMTGKWYLVRPLFNLAINERRYFGFIDGKLMYVPTPTEMAVEQARASNAAREASNAAREAARIEREAARIEREAARIELAQVVTLPELFQNFEGNHLRADANYLNKAVRVTGVLRAFESFWGEYYFVEIGGDGVIESFRERSLIILLGRLSPWSTGTVGRGRYAADSNDWRNKADETKESLLNLTIGETYTFYCESPSRQLLSDTMNHMYRQEQEFTDRPNLRWLGEKRGLAEQNGAYLCTKGEVIK